MVGGREGVAIIMCLCRRLKQWYKLVSGAQLSKDQSKQLDSTVKDHFDVCAYFNHITIQ